MSKWLNIIRTLNKSQSNMKRMLIHFDDDKHEVRGGITDGSVLNELDLTIKKLNNIYYGVIKSVDIEHVNVDFGADKLGVIPIKNILPVYISNKKITIGQNILVQVVDESHDTILTTFICLSGTYLKFFPKNLNSIDKTSFTFSNFFNNKLVEQQYNLNSDLGIQLSKDGEGKSEEELEWDLAVLMHHWEAIKDATLNCKPTVLIHQNSNPILDIIKMLPKTEVTEVYLDNLKSFESIKKHLNAIGSKVKVFFYEQPDNILTSHKYIDWEVVKLSQKTNAKKSIFQKIFSIFSK